MTAPSLTEFLLARYAEEWNLVAHSPEHDDTRNDMRIEWAEVGAISEVLWIGEARLRSEIEVKRRIVEAHTAVMDDRDEDTGVEYWSDCPDCLQAPPCRTLRLLGTVYADRPEFRDEWRS